MPCAPKLSQSLATCTRSGLLPPRELRRVAILFILTDNRVMLSRYFYSCKYHYYLLICELKYENPCQIFTVYFAPVPVCIYGACPAKLRQHYQLSCLLR